MAVHSSRIASRTTTSRAPRFRIARSMLLYVVLCVLAFIDLFPLLWIGLSSFKTQSEIFRMPPTVLPDQPTLGNYAEGLGLLPRGQQPISDIPIGLTNSLTVALSSTIVMLVLGSMAGYAFARLRFPGRRALLILILSLRMLPGVVLAVPLFLLATWTRVFDTQFVLIVVYSAFNLPFAIWLLTVFFQEVPQELEDAARVDGCTRWSVLYRIYLPLSLPALATIGILGFLAAWNEFLFAVTLTSTAAGKTVPVALASMQAAFQTRWAIMTAGAVLQSLPALLLVLVAQRYIVKGLSMGAVKG